MKRETKNALDKKRDLAKEVESAREVQ